MSKNNKFDEAIRRDKTFNLNAVIEDLKHEKKLEKII